MSGPELIVSPAVTKALYKALKAACDNSEKLRKNGHRRPDGSNISKLYLNAVAALAKARGESA